MFVCVCRAVSSLKGRTAIKVERGGGGGFNSRIKDLIPAQKVYVVKQDPIDRISPLI